MAKKISANDVMSFLAGLMSAGVPGGSPASLLMGGMGGFGGTGGIAGGGEGAARGYPEEFAPGAYHVYNVVYAPRPDGVRGPYANMNYMGKADAATIDEAAEQQTIQEHNDVLTKYVRMLPRNATPRQVRDAIQRGREEEKQLPRWWNESNNRREFSVSSSAVKGIRITPEGNIEVRWGKTPTWYTFKKYGNTQLASQAARELLRSDSIGRAVYPVVSRGIAKPGLGDWNRKNYAEEYAR